MAQLAGRDALVQQVIVSFPGTRPPKDTDEAAKQRNLVYEIAKFIGLDGGVVIFHHKRITKQGKHPGSQNIHYHIVGHGWVCTEYAFVVYHELGIVVKALGRTVNREDQISYLLSHASIPSVVTNPAIVKSTSAIHWFGTWSYNVPNIEKMPEMIHCPGCERDYHKKDWMRIFFIGSDPPEDQSWGLLEGYQWRAVDCQYVM